MSETAEKPVIVTCIPAMGETVAYVLPSGQFVFRGKVVKIVPRQNDTLYRLEDEEGRYEWAYSCGVCRPEDVPPQKVQTWDDLKNTPTPYITGSRKY
jgi:hypothetical protein